MKNMFSTIKVLLFFGILSFGLLSFNYTNAATVGYSLSNAEPMNKSYQFNTFASDIIYNNNGSIMYVVVSNKVIGYRLSTPYDATTASYNGYSFTFSVYPQGIAFNNDGLKMYSIESGYIYEYSLTIAYNVNTLVKSANKYKIETGFNGVSALEFSANGSKMFLMNATEVREYHLTSPWDILSVVNTGNKIPSGQDSGSFSIRFSFDGKKLFTGHKEYIYAYKLKTPWDLSSLYSNDEFLNISEQTGQIMAINFSADGKQMYINGLSRNIEAYNTSIDSEYENSNYVDGQVFNSYQEWKKSRLVKGGDKTLVLLKMMIDRVYNESNGTSTTSSPNTFVDINGDGLVDMLNVSKFKYQKTKYSGGIFNAYGYQYAIMINNGDYTFKNVYKCVSDERYYYGDCAQ